MAELKVVFAFPGTHLYRARLREKISMKSQIVYRVGPNWYDVENDLRKEFGNVFFITEVTRLTPAQVIRAARKHLPNINAA